MKQHSGAWHSDSGRDRAWLNMYALTGAVCCLLALEEHHNVQGMTFCHARCLLNGVCHIGLDEVSTLSDCRVKSLFVVKKKASSCWKWVGLILRQWPVKNLFLVSMWIGQHFPFITGTQPFTWPGFWTGLTLLGFGAKWTGHSVCS